MTRRLRIGILGATGMVGQNYLRLLDGHPWFEVVYLAASPKSAGQTYADAVAGRWQMATPIPERLAKVIVADASDVASAAAACDLVFCAADLEKTVVAKLELDLAAAGLAVVSNNSAHRHTPFVPMVIPEVNPEHLGIIPAQRKLHGWAKGLLAVKSNCSIQSHMAPVFALQQAGFPVAKMFVTTLQAVSGAGYPGPASIDLLDNIVPLIVGEEDKTEREPLKILGKVEGDRIVNATSPLITAHCNRVPVVDGHTACVSIGFAERKPSVSEAIAIWQNFTGIPQQLRLPMAPKQPIIYQLGDNRPQPRKDRDLDKGMAVSVGRLRPCNLLDLKFVGLHHNTVRGAAGGAILTAELIVAQGYLD
jgi:aspartate-semialdehyde dehydrogenase